MDNEIYLAKTYIALGQSVEAVVCLESVLEMEMCDEIDKAHHGEAAELLEQLRG
jgi:hypothetical protein